MAFAPDIALRKIEFDFVIERVAELAVTEPGHVRARRITPFQDRDEIVLELRRVTEIKELLIAEGSIPLESIRDVLPALKKTTVENQTLSAAELLDIGSLLRVARSLKAFFAKRTPLVPTISSLITRLSGEKVVEYNIAQALDEHGGVKDSASRELREIRHGMISAGEALRRRLASILRSVSEQDLTQEEIITTRDGRLVIPIKTEHKNRVPGFIHSTSASGATVFIEPAESLELNNTLRELQIREHREIHRILRDLTSQVGEIRPLCEESFFALVEIDVLAAKARYSVEVIGVAPSIALSPGFRIVLARHPVLLRHMKRDDIIPLTVEIKDTNRTLIISGPNAGGKTVALKTVGLFCAMANAGLHVPAASETEIFPFSRMFVDIGDDQSLENDLSTFSSHLVMLKHVLDEADKESLVLLDEVGTGTDPTEGGALAAAVLNTLTDRGATTIATTHHGALKVFAHETPGIMNGSMEFDTSTLRPSYRFHSGVPGSSYAFELAERIGLSEKTLEDARDRVGEEKTRMESLLLDLETKVRAYEERLRDTEDERQRLQSTVKSFEHQTAQLRLELGTIRKKALEDAKEIVKNAQKTIEESVRTIRESGGDREIIRASRGAVKKLQDHLVATCGNEPEEETTDESFLVGDNVQVKGGTSTGEIVDIRGSQATIISGQSRLKMPLNRLTHVKTAAVQQTIQRETIMPEAAPEIDLRGMLGDEALDRLIPFLDNAYAVGLQRVDIIHGKGTGALRKRVGEYLKSVPHVKSFRFGEWNEGGTGVTVVELS